MQILTDEIIPKRILMEVLKRRSNIISNPQTGKTNLLKVIVSEIVRQKLPCQIRIYDTAQVLRHSFLSSFKFQEINNNTREKYNGQDNILFDIEYAEGDKTMEFIGNDILQAYQYNRQRKKFNGGKLNDWILYGIEEAHGSFDRYLLNRRDGKIWLKLISEGANFNLSYIFIGQRLAEISTGAVERSSCYFIGKTTGDNNITKLKRIVGKDSGTDQLGVPLHEKAKFLTLGEFIYWSGSEAWLFRCPLFENLYPNQKPVQIEPPKRRWFKLW